MARIPLASSLAAGLFAARALAATVQMDWVLPQNPDFSSNFTQGQDVTLQWTSNLQDWFSSYCAPCDQTNVDLWVVGGTNDVYQYKIAASIDVQSTLSQAWTVLIPDDVLVKQQVWSLRFIPSGDVPHGAGDGAEISSPQFQITAAVVASTTTTTTTSATATAAAETSTAAAITTTASSGSGGGLSTGASAGIGAGIGVVALAAIAFLAFWLIRRRRNKKNAGGDVSQMERHAPPQEYHQAHNADLGSPAAGYFQRDVKDASHASSPAPPYKAYIPPMSEAASTPHLPRPVTAELNASVDPAELEGSHGVR